MVRLCHTTGMKQNAPCSWWVYIIRCADGSLYTGTTNNLERRIALHKSGKGAKYTRSHIPEKIVYSEICITRSAACIREAAIKKLSKSEKELLLLSSTKKPLGEPKGFS